MERTLEYPPSIISHKSITYYWIADILMTEFGNL